MTFLIKLMELPWEMDSHVKVVKFKIVLLKETLFGTKKYFLIFISNV